MIDLIGETKISEELMSSEEWEIHERAYDPAKFGFYESILALGNGYIGSRAVLEEKPPGSSPGTYIAGIYSSWMDDKPPQLINLPNPFYVELEDPGKILDHSRTLDLKHGILRRFTHFSNGEYYSERFLSMENVHLGGMKIRAEFEVNPKIDIDVKNSMGLESPICHFKIIHQAEDQLRILTNSGELTYLYRVESNSKEIKLSFWIGRSNQNPQWPPDYDSILRKHISAWESLWDVADIEADGDTLGLRFASYHLLSSAPKPGIDASIPAKGYTGEGYNGHIFWDTEIYMLPFFIRVSPKIARNLLEYRARRLNEAERNAKLRGYSGALYPWESADKGDDVTPRYFVVIDKNKIQVYAPEREHHISGAIAYAIANYYNWTGDLEFMREYGDRMIAKIAEFWESRVEKIDGEYHIRRVIGPNEFQICVDNNAYTNYLAKFCLEYALSRNLGNGKWREIASKIRIPRWGKLIQEFDGYLELRDAVVQNPDFPRAIHIPPAAERPHLHRLQLVKQADVVLMFALFPKDFDYQTKLENFSYYELRTTHSSSLSPGIYGLVAADLGFISKAYKYFKLACYMDLEDIHGNTHLGIHAAALGSALELAVRGFAGLRLDGEKLVVDPRIPWKRMRFSGYWRGNLLRFELDDHGTSIKVANQGPNPVPIIIRTKEYILNPGDRILVKQ